MDIGRETTSANTVQIKSADGRPQGPTPRILSPLYLSPRQGSPTIGRIGSSSPCIVGVGEDVDVGWGPCGRPWMGNPI